MDVEERDDFAEGSRQPGNGGQDGADFLPSLDPAVGPRLVRGHGVRDGQRQGFQVLASQHPVSAVPHDAPQPAGERGRVGEAGQRIPGGDERLLDDVLRLPEVPDERQRVAEGHVLEAPGDLGERVEVALRRRPHRRFQVHRPSLTSKCHDPEGQLWRYESQNAGPTWRRPEPDEISARDGVKYATRWQIILSSTGTSARDSWTRSPTPGSSS